MSHGRRGDGGWFQRGGGEDRGKGGGENVEGDGVVVMIRSGLSRRDGGGGFEFGHIGEDRGWWRNSRVLPELGEERVVQWGLEGASDGFGS